MSGFFGIGMLLKEEIVKKNDSLVLFGVEFDNEENVVLYLLLMMDFIKEDFIV